MIKDTDDILSFPMESGVRIFLFAHFAARKQDWSRIHKKNDRGMSSKL